LGFYLGGKHEESIEGVIKFLQSYLEKTSQPKVGKKIRLSMLHTVYFALKFSMLRMLGEDRDWKDVLVEVHQELKLDDERFKEKVEEILNRFREEIKEMIKRGELV